MIIRHHIRVLRAEADALQVEADESVLIAPNSPVHVMLQRLSNAKRWAADRLEEEEAAKAPPLEGAEGHRHARYDPKGRKPTNEA